ncbi:Major Facilitator Superfamily protein [Nocardiopsis flavescens]|uniref:Major Facilitator Superfamily protein n=1 Tax=Nocardiopsis flavescens TaxID=758803 RepID=A0A1M6BB14_9ACTN|nr:MFS transporter [Nocardiopsis flavescens]SHI45954.1 Major Facilitator Superfamily protein [Nocardiopsis flavescens]
MFSLFTRARRARLGRLTGPLYVYAVAEEFVLLYAVYALLFADHGLSVAQIASLFMLWSGVGLVVSVPAGALADVVPRRYLLAAAPVFAGAAFSLWLLFPGYAVFALGFVLWGAGGALSSGALEALVHDDLSWRGAAERYARVMGVTRALGVAAVGAATLAAVPVMAWGGYAAVGVVSVAVCGVCALAGLALPENRPPAPGAGAEASGGAVPAGAHRPHHPSAPGEAGADPEEEPATPAEYVAALRAGVREARRDRRVRGAIVLLVVVTSFWGMLDEYVPLLVSGHGVSAAGVPAVLAVVWAGVTLGGLSAGVLARLPVRVFAVLLGAAGVAVAAGAVLGGVPGWVLLGAGFGVCQAASVVADARLQERITGRSRATVTSVAGLGTDLVTTAAYPLYAVVFAVSGHGWAFAVFAVPYLVAACVVGRGGRRSVAVPG